jgi:hypothetical protein
MKKILFLIVIGVSFYAYSKYGKPRTAIEVTNPVFSEFRMQMSKPHGGRSVEGLLLSRFASEAECQGANSASRKVIEHLAGSQNADCPDCNLAFKAPTCSNSLPVRYEVLFENAPTNLSYLSWSYTSPAPMEIRMIFWNVNPEEAKTACEAGRVNAEKKLQTKTSKLNFFATNAVVGTVRCVHPAR